MDEMMKTIAANKLDEVAEMHGHEMNEIINRMEHGKALEDEISKQRYYGKVEMILNLIRIEDSSNKIGGTFLDKIVEWSGLKEEEIRRLQDIAYNLDETIITGEVFFEERYREWKTREEREAFEKMFLGMHDIIRRNGILFTVILAVNGEETAYAYAKAVLELNGIMNEDKLALFQKMLMEFAEMYVLRVGELLQENNAYPYDLIASAMVQYFVDEKTFRRLLQRFEKTYEGDETNE